MRHLRITGALVGYTAVVIFIFRIIPFTWISEEHFLNSIISYYIVAALFMGLVFIKGVDSLEYFRLPELNARSITAMSVAAAMVSQQFFGGRNEMKPWSVAVPGVIFLFGIGFAKRCLRGGCVLGCSVNMGSVMRLFSHR